MSVNDKVSFCGVLISIHVHDPTRRTLANITHCFPSTSRMRIYVARVPRVVNRWSCEERKRDSIRWAAWRKLGHRVVSRYCWPYEFFNSPFDQSSVYESRISTVVKSIPPAVADWRLLVFFFKTLHIEFCHSLIFLLFYLSFFFYLSSNFLFWSLFGSPHEQDSMFCIFFRLHRWNIRSLRPDFTS